MPKLTHSLERKTNFARWITSIYYQSINMSSTQKSFYQPLSANSLTRCQHRFLRSRTSIKISRLAQKPEVVDAVGDMFIGKTRTVPFNKTIAELQGIQLLVQKYRMTMIVYHRNTSQVEHTFSSLPVQVTLFSESPHDKSLFLTIDKSILSYLISSPSLPYSALS